MTALNYIFFLLFVLFGIFFLYKGSLQVHDVLNPRRRLLFNGPESLLLFIFSTGLVALSSATGSVDLSAIRLLFLEGFCFWGIAVSDNRMRWSIPLFIYLLYMAWLCFGLTYAPYPSFGLRVILKYLYPLLIALFAATVVRYGEVFLKCGVTARNVGAIIVILGFVPYLFQTFLPGLIWYPTARSIHFISMCIFSLAFWQFCTHKRRDLLLAVLFILPCLVWVLRTSMMGFTLAAIVYALFRYRIKAIPWIVAAMAIFISVIFFVPEVKNKMFRNSDEVTLSDLRNNLSKEDIDSNGRFAMWEWSLENYYEPNKIWGSGTGTLQEVFYSGKVDFNGIRIVHNDYVQILCDNGLIGCILFIGILISALLHCWNVYNRSRSNTTRMAAIVAASTLAGIFLTSLTDNSINYSVATYSSAFGFYGMMVGMYWTERHSTKQTNGF